MENRTHHHVITFLRKVKSWPSVNTTRPFLNTFVSFVPLHNDNKHLRSGEHLPLARFPMTPETSPAWIDFVIRHRTVNYPCLQSVHMPVFFPATSFFVSSAGITAALNF